MAKTSKAIGCILDSRQIQGILPQRFPFLFIDRVIAFDKKSAKIICIKNVTINEHFFQGHFPGNPVMPGALIVEAMAQASIILYAMLKPELAAKQPDYLLGKIEAGFRKPVTAGDQLVIEVQKEKLLDTAGMVHATAKVNGDVTSEASISFGVRFK